MPGFVRPFSTGYVTPDGTKLNQLAFQVYTLNNNAPSLPLSYTQMIFSAQAGTLDQFGFSATVTTSTGQVVQRASPATGPAGFAQANFSYNAVTRVGPVMNNMVGWFVLGIDSTQTLVNLAPGGVNATAVGTPVLRPSFATLGQGNYLQTSVSDSVAYTVLAVARLRDGVTTPRGGTIVSCFATDPNSSGSTNKFGPLLSILQDSTTVLTGSIVNRVQYVSPASQAYTDATPTAAITNTSQWRFIVATGSQANSFIQDLTNGVSQTLPNSTAGYRFPNTSVSLRLGSDNGPSFQNLIDISEVVIYSRVLSTAEIASMYAFMQGFQSFRGISV